MKKSKFEKLTNEIIENGKKTLDNLNDLIQGCNEKDGITISNLSNSYTKISDLVAFITDIKESTINRNKEADFIYGFKSSFDLEDDD